MRTSQVENHGLKHQLKKLFLPSGHSVRTIRTGILAGVAMDLDLAHHTQRWLGLQERELNGWFRRLSGGIRTGIDVGANDGLYTLYFLAKTPAQRVFAFEPASDCIEQMKRNLALNGYENDPRVDLITQPVGAVNGGQDVTLDSYLDRIQFPCLVKVDIDGGEIRLLEGAQRLLASKGVRWIIEVHSPALQEQCLDILRRANYQTVVVRNAWWRHFLPELRPGDLNQWIVAVPSGPA
jgi:Methyltransferase FkbM domain